MKYFQVSHLAKFVLSIDITSPVQLVFLQDKRNVWEPRWRIPNSIESNDAFEPNEVSRGYKVCF